MDVRFIDTTFRDGSQSLWASGIRPGMMEAVAEDMDRAGFDAIEVPGGSYIKKCVRDPKEDPWAMTRMLAGKMPKVVKSSMGYYRRMAGNALPDITTPCDPASLHVNAR